MTRHILLALSLMLAAPANAQTANPDVYLAPVSRIGDSIIVGTPVNISHRIGYDNQPSFTFDSRSLLYTAQADGQMDIWRYDIKSHATTQLTHTPESEYSATQIPGERRFSVVRVEHDSAQRLWSFAMNGRDPRVELSALKPLGYHAWLSSRRLAAYVLGTPTTLHLINRDGTRDTVIARDVGRSIQAMPLGANAQFSFTQRDAAGQLHIYIYTGRTVKRRFAHERVTVAQEGLGARRQTLVDSTGNGMEPPYELVPASTDNEFHVWMPDVMLLTTSSSVLMRWNAQLGAASAWLPVTDLKQFGVTHVTRLAVSPDGRWLAFVAEPATP